MSVALRVDSKMGYAFYVDYVDLFVVKYYNYNKKEKDIYVKLSNCQVQRK